MHFVCCIKMVPDTAEVKIDPETNTLVRAGVESIPNPYDMVALEEALRLRREYGGKVTALSMGPSQADAVLRQALTMGADAAVLLSDRAFAGSDTLATSYTLSKAIEKINRADPVDAVFCGKQAIDGDTAQTGPGTAVRLGYTPLTYVIQVQWIDQKKRTIQVVRKVEGGTEIICGTLPVLITAELELAKPHRASLSLMIHSLRSEIPVWHATDIDASSEFLGIKGSPTWVRKVSAPPAHEGGPKFVAGDAPAEAVRRCLDTLIQDEAFGTSFLNKWEV